MGLLLMLQHLVGISQAKRAAAPAVAASPGSSKAKKDKKGLLAPSTPEQTGAATAAGADSDDQEVWLPELMASLCERVSILAPWLTAWVSLHRSLLPRRSSLCLSVSAQSSLSCWAWLNPQLHACMTGSLRVVRVLWMVNDGGLICCCLLAREETLFHICTSG